MAQEMTRRTLLATAGLGAALGVAGNSAAEDQDDAPVLIVGVACSPRKGMTTATAMAAALDAAKETDARIETKLVDLGGMTIAGTKGDGHPAAMPSGAQDDFDRHVLPALEAPNLGGILIGSPAYFRCMSSLCMAFLERLAILRQPTLRLAGIPVGALSVGAYRNGGQELVIQQILTVMLCHQSMLAGGHAPAFQGATLWNAHQDDITKDEFGMASARNLGINIANAALKLKA